GFDGNQGSQPPAPGTETPPAPIGYNWPCPNHCREAHVTDPRSFHDQAVASFYHLGPADAVLPEMLPDVLTGRCCRGLACFAARQGHPQRWQQACSTAPALYCLGQCYAGPAQAGTDTRPTAHVFARESVLLANAVRGGVRDLPAYLAQGGGKALRAALQSTPSAILETV